MEEKEQGLIKTDFNTFNSITDIKIFAKEILQSNLCPKHIENEADVVIAVTTGKELGFSPLMSLKNIFPINGIPTLGVHIKTSLILKAGIFFKITKDCVPLEIFQDKIGNYYTPKEIETGNFQVVTAKTPKEAIIPTKIPVISIVNDWITEIEFERDLQLSSGRFKVLKHIQTFKYSEAVSAKLTESKDVWKKWKSRMMFSRCFSFGCAVIADDILQGIYETTEQADISGISYDFDDNGNLIVYKNTNKKETKAETTNYEEIKINQTS